MRRFRRSDRGLSEIVGTLMLVIIVVTAATLLAAFVASYQKQVQAEQTFSHDQSLESIRILGINTTVTDGSYTSFGFTIASKYVNPSTILSISINNQPLKYFGWEDVGTSSSHLFVLGQDLNLSPFEEISIWLSLNPSSGWFSFLSSLGIPQPNQYLKFDVDTILQNDFTRVFLPPTALAVVSEIDPSSNNPITLLDGSTSFQPGTNASIVAWNWTVAGGGPTSNAPGTVISVNGGTNGALTGSAGGMVWTGSASATFTVPTSFTFGGQDSVALVAPSDLVVTGTGCSGSAQAITDTPAPSGSTSGNQVTVTFPFSVTITGASCTTGTLSIDSGGVILTPIPMPLSASGEEYEISPVLPLPITQQTPYSVTLTVTNSDGLAGTVTLAYTPIT